MDRITIEEVISQLAKIGRPDLIDAFKEIINETYFPDEEEDTTESDSDDSVEEEIIKTHVDSQGFHSLT